MLKRQPEWIAEWQRRNPGKDIRDELIRLQESGWTQAEIGRLFQRDRTTISRAFKAFGIAVSADAEAVA